MKYPSERILEIYTKKYLKLKDIKEAKFKAILDFLDEEYGRIKKIKIHL
jgi:hypothetical protein